MMKEDERGAQFWCNIRSGTESQWKQIQREREKGVDLVRERARKEESGRERDRVCVRETERKGERESRRKD